MVGTSQNGGSGPQRYQGGRARHYDRELIIRVAAGVRRRAVQSLRLAPGETVLDIACGTGLNLPSLSAGVGERGRVIGIDISSEMLEIARDRVETGGLRNVELVNAAVEEAGPPATANAALFSFAHDVLHSSEAIEQALAWLRPGARVVACGA